MAVLTPHRMTVNSKEIQFFKALGARIAQARKDQGLTQQQLAEHLGIVQQAYAHYEMGHVRFSASMLPILGQVLDLTPEELLGQERPKSKRGPTSRLQQQVDRISRLPQTKQHVVMEMLEMVITSQASH